MSGLTASAVASLSARNRSSIGAASTGAGMDPAAVASAAISASGRNRDHARSNASIRTPTSERTVADNSTAVSMRQRVPIASNSQRKAGGVDESGASGAVTPSLRS